MKNKFLLTSIAGILIALAILLGLVQRNLSPEPIPQESPVKINLESQGLEVLGITTNVENIHKNTIATTFTAGGDVSLSRFIAHSIDKNNNPLLPFERLDEILSAADFNFANLESPFSKNNNYKVADTLVFNAPKKNIAGLIKYNFKIMNLANNHALDQGQEGVFETLDWLKVNGIESVGLGKNLDEAYAGKVIESNGIKIGFVCASYASENDGGKKANKFVARMEDLDRLKSEIAKLKSQSDYVVACMHGGNEYSRKPNNLQKNFAYGAIDAGADLVIGHHPHWIQPIEKYNGKYIFYSLGNLIFDQDWSRETREGLLVKVNLAKNETDVSDWFELIPVIIENNNSPRAAEAEESKKILEKINQKEKVLW